MTTSTVTSPKVSFSKLLWVGPLAVVVSVVVNVIIRFIAVALLNPPEQFMPLSVQMPIVFTVFGGLMAVIAFAIVAKVARNPVRTYQIVAVVALIISFIPDILLLATAGQSPFPGASVGTVGALMLMHLATGIIMVYSLTHFTLAEK
jgi:Family of unknown function (DUF6069)